MQECTTEHERLVRSTEHGLLIRNCDVCDAILKCGHKGQRHWLLA